LAFVLLFSIAWGLKALVSAQNKKRAAIGLAAVVGLVLGYFVFMKLPFDPSSALGELQQRLEYTDQGFAGDNRMTEYADAAYEDFLKSDLKTIMLGYGNDSRNVPGTNYSIWQNAHSYKEFIFNFGFVGFGILILFFILAVRLKYKNVQKNNKRDILILLIVFLIYIYQRYGVDTFFYFCLLFGGASNLVLMGTHDDNTLEQQQYQDLCEPTET
jgi:O-antigen ligase